MTWISFCFSIMTQPKSVIRTGGNLNVNAKAIYREWLETQKTGFLLSLELRVAGFDVWVRVRHSRLRQMESGFLPDSRQFCQEKLCGLWRMWFLCVLEMTLYRVAVFCLGVFGFRMIGFWLVVISWIIEEPLSFISALVGNLYWFGFGFLGASAGYFDLGISSLLSFRMCLDL